MFGFKWENNSCALDTASMMVAWLNLELKQQGNNEFEQQLPDVIKGYVKHIHDPGSSSKEQKDLIIKSLTEMMCSEMECFLNSNEKQITGKDKSVHRAFDALTTGYSNEAFQIILEATLMSELQQSSLSFCEGHSLKEMDDDVYILLETEDDEQHPSSIDDKSKPWLHKKRTSSICITFTQLEFYDFNFSELILFQITERYQVTLKCIFPRSKCMIKTVY
jgi:hypothetical protein